MIGFKRALLVLALLLVVSPASAAKNIHFSDSTVVSKSQLTLEKALLAYGSWCDEGCRYKSPGVKVDEKLAFKSTSTKFYTWTWVSDIKDLKYFSEVTISKTMSSFTITKRALGDADESLVAQLKKASGRPHKPLLDSSVNIVKLERITDKTGPKCKVTMDTTVRVGGLLSIFSGRVLSGLKKSTQALFKALKK